MLDPIQNHALRLCLGAFRTFPATSLCVAVNEPPLELGRTQLCLQYVLKLGSNQLNPTHNVVFNAKFKSAFQRKAMQIPLLSIRVSFDLKDVGFQKRNVLSSNIVSTPPWLLMRPIVNYSLHSADKADIPAEIHKHRFYELCNKYADYCSIYSDGSKAGERVASAIIYKSISKSLRLPNLTSIFRAELYALFLAINVIRR